MKTAIALALTVASIAVLAGCPDNNQKAGATPSTSAAPAAKSAAPVASDKRGSGW